MTCRPCQAVQKSIAQKGGPTAIFQDRLELVSQSVIIIISVFLKGHERCALNCMPKGKYFYFRWADKVVDGTRCSVDSYDICVDGKCEVKKCIRCDNFISLLLLRAHVIIPAFFFFFQTKFKFCSSAREPGADHWVRGLRLQQEEFFEVKFYKLAFRSVGAFV